MYENPNEYQGVYDAGNLHPAYDQYEENPEYGDYDHGEYFPWQQKHTHAPLRKGTGLRRMFLNRQRRAQRDTKLFSNWRKQSRDLRTQIRQAKSSSLAKPTRGSKGRGQGTKASSSFPSNVPVLVPKRKPSKRPLPLSRKGRPDPVKKPFMKPPQPAPVTPWRKASRHLRVEIDRAKRLSPRPKDEEVTFPDVEVFVPGKGKPKLLRKFSSGREASKGQRRNQAKGGKNRGRRTPNKSRPAPKESPSPAAAGGQPGSNKKSKNSRRNSGQGKLKKINLKKVPYKQPESKE